MKGLAPTADCFVRVLLAAVSPTAVQRCLTQVHAEPEGTAVVPDLLQLGTRKLAAHAVGLLAENVGAQRAQQNCHYRD